MQLLEMGILYSSYQLDFYDLLGFQFHCDEESIR